MRKFTKIIKDLDVLVDIKTGEAFKSKFYIYDQKDNIIKCFSTLETRLAYLEEITDGTYKKRTKPERFILDFILLCMFKNKINTNDDESDYAIRKYLDNEISISELNHKLKDKFEMGDL